MFYPEAFLFTRFLSFSTIQMSLSKVMFCSCIQKVGGYNFRRDTCYPY